MATGYTPIYRIFRNGIDFTDRFNDRTVSISVELQSGGEAGDICEIVLDDRDWAIAFPEVGERIEVYLGYTEVGLAFMGSFEIDEVEFAGPPRSIMIHGNSMGMASAITAPMIETHLSSTLGSVLERLGEASGLKSFVHPDLASKALPVLLQTASPLHQIDQLARNFGAIAKITADTLSFVPRDRGVSVSGAVIPILGLLPEHFGSWSVRHMDRTDYSQVLASYWDTDNSVRKWVGQGRLGGSQPIVEEREYRIGRIFESEEAAKSAARATLEQMVRSAGTFYGTLAKGDPWIRDQQRLSVRGMREGINGSYVINRAVHTYTSEAGISTALEATSTGTGEDFEEAAEDAFMLPLPGELLGEVLRGASGLLAGPV